MLRPCSLRLLLPLILAVLLLAACDDTEGGDSGVTEARATDSVQSSTTTEPTATSTTTTTTPQATSTTEAIPEVGVPGPGEPWDLLVIRNSYLLSALVPELYAQRAEEALGVEIRLHDAGGQDPFRAWQVLSQLQDEAYPPLAELARHAEIIVVYADPEDSGPGRSDTVIDGEFENCLSGMLADPHPPVLSTVEEWQPYRDYLDAIYAEIWALRQGAPTVLVATDLHNPDLVKFQRERNLDVACTAYWASWSDVIRQAAEDNGATMVSIFEVLNGPDGSLGPWELGYTGHLTTGNPTTRYEETNEVGSEMVADALAAAGFEPTTRP